MDYNYLFPQALSYDDILIVPQRSRVTSRKFVDTTGYLTRNIKLNTPIVGANMDSVSSVDQAVSMALAGGIQILHRFNTIDEMVEEIKNIKRAGALKILDPCTITKDCTALEAQNLMKTKNISGLLVVEGEKLLGIFTRRDIETARDKDALVGELMVTGDKLITGDWAINTAEAEEIMTANRIEKLPLVDDNGNLIGLMTLRDIRSQKKYPSASRDMMGRLMVGAAVGVRGDYIERALAVEAAGADLVCLDIAHGHMEAALDAVKELKKHLSIDVLAGNVATYDGARDLIEAGADGIKTGVGPGAACITRVVAGVGVPTVTSILDTVKASKEHGVPVCADGGIRYPGDVSKAIGLGADTVMIGSLLAGTDEAPSELVEKKDRSGGKKLMKRYRGMASAGAAEARKNLDGPIQEKELAHLSDQIANEFNHTTPEGVEALVPYRGSTMGILAELTGGLKSGMSYSDSMSLSEYHEKAKFTRITNAGLVESHPHDLEL